MAQLDAIYKLKFYKNKKDWQLTKQEQISRPQTPNSEFLNQTHSIEDMPAEPEYQTEQSPLNKAFLHKEPGGREDEETADLVPAEVDLPEPTTEWKDHEVKMEDHEVYWGDIIQQQEWCGPQAEGMPEELADDECDGPYHHHFWPPVCEVSQPGVDLPGLSTEELLRAADFYLPDTHSKHSDHFFSLDETAEFFRGAHSVPHSSEIDLRDYSHECLCGRDLCWRLSNAQLQRALQLHRAILAALLHEKTIRGTQFFPSAVLPKIPRDLPIRDIDPIIGGSHRADTGTGRGRGRLLQLDNNLFGT